MKKKQKKLLLSCIAVMIAILGAIWYPQAEQLTVQNAIPVSTTIETEIQVDSSKLNIFFLDVGQADSHLILLNGETMLIDAGNNADGKYIVQFLKERNIEKLDYVIGTHIHEDHVGGLDDIIDSFPIENLYLPESNSSNKYYKDILESMQEKNLTAKHGEVGETFTLGDAECEIMAVDNTMPEEANDQSMVIELTYQEEKYLFMGDAEKKTENKRAWNDVFLLKVGHHGSETSSSEDFLTQVKPETAIIPVGEGNSYGLPKASVLERLEDSGATVYRTDEKGTIHFVSDGENSQLYCIETNIDGDSIEE